MQYRHPALSSRKILISATGVCKLYDFCPVHVAMDTVSQILEKVNDIIPVCTTSNICKKKYPEKQVKSPLEMDSNLKRTPARKMNNLSKC